MYNDTVMDSWATNMAGPVALHLRQKLLPVEGEGGVVFPPTYAGGGYNMDKLADGTFVATMDSVGSQANRVEPIFKDPALASLVPQITIKVNDSQSVSILDVGHRLGDALVRATDFAEGARNAFLAFLGGDAWSLAKLAPTSLVFGAWDSRDTSAKLPRLFQSVVRAWDVQELKRSAQYVPPVDYAALEVFSEEDKVKAEAEGGKSPLAQRGFVHVPSVGVPGGVLAKGPIYRDITLNLVALRQLKASQEKDTVKLRHYLLGLALVAATHPLDGFLRQGCLLTLDPAEKGQWKAVGRDGVRTSVELDETIALDYAQAKAKGFEVGANREATFDPKKAKQDLSDAKEKKENKKSKKQNG